MVLLPDRHQFAMCKEASDYDIPHEFVQFAIEKKNSICLGKCLDMPTPNRASIVCFSFKTGSTQMLA